MESGLYDNGFMGGRFYWWLGQVVDSKLWRENLTDKKTPSSEIPGWGYRYKVMIMGLHDQGASENFKEKLYWAQVMHSVWGGGEGGSFQTPGIKQGSFVFGWFLDGNDKQLPIIMGVLGKNAVTEIEKLGVQTYAGSSGYDNSGTTFVGDSEILTKDKKKVLTNEAVDGSNVEVKADAVINTKHTECFHVECTDPREQSEMTGIQLAIEKMTSEVEKVQKSLVDLESAITLPVMKLDTEINDILDKYSGDVTEKMGVILGKVEHFSQASLTEKALGLIALAPPSQAKKLGKKQQEEAARLACVFNKIKGNLLGLIGKALRKSFYGDGQRALPPEGFYRPNPACATEDMIADVMVETLDEIVSTFNDANEGVIGQTGGGPLAGVKGAIGKLSNLQNLGSGVITGALGGIGGGALGKLAGSLDFLNGFGALGGMNLDMSIAMTFVAGVKAFYECDTKKKCSDYQRDCVKGVKNMDNKKPDSTNISKNISDKVSPSNKEVFDNLTEGQKNRILNAPINTNVEGVIVSERIKFELRQYEMSSGVDNIAAGISNKVDVKDYKVGDITYDGETGRAINPETGEFLSPTAIEQGIAAAEDTNIPSGDDLEAGSFGITPEGAQQALNNRINAASNITGIPENLEAGSFGIGSKPEDNFLEEALKKIEVKSNETTSTFSKPRRGSAFTGETSLDQIANRLNLGTSKKFVDEYITYVNGGDQDKDLTNLMSQDAKNNLRNILNREKKTIDFLLTNSSDKEVRDHVRQSIINAGDRSLDLQNSLGNGNNLDVEYYRQTGKYRFKNTYVFTEERDLEIRASGIIGGISERTIGIPIRNAPKNYVINKIGGKKNLNKVIQNPMRYTIEIDP